MKRFTIVGCFVCLLSLSMSAQVLPISEIENKVNSIEIYFPVVTSVVQEINYNLDLKTETNGKEGKKLSKGDSAPNLEQETQRGVFHRDRINNYNCSEENPNDFIFISGYNCSSSTQFKNANDITIAANENFTLEKITAIIFSHGRIVNVDVNYYTSDLDLPGILLHSDTSVEIENQTVIGSRLGYNIIELELDVPSYTFIGQMNAPTTYWIQLSITNENSSGFIYWVVTESSRIGNPTALFDTNVWQSPELNWDGIYTWEGRCSIIGTDCTNPSNLTVDAISENAADISWTAGGSETNWIVKYGEQGFNPTSEGITVSVSGSPDTSLSGLGPNTDYDIYVKSDCRPGQSVFTGPLTFTTLPDIEASYFITTWKVDNSDRSITIPTVGDGYDYYIDWGDGSSNSGVNGNISHEYSGPGTYTVRILGDFPRIFFHNTGDVSKIQTIEQWGNIVWRSFNSAFMGCYNLSSNAMDMPDISLVTDMYGAFAYARAFRGDANIGNWDVSNVTRMHAMFGGAYRFNSDIGNWNVGNVTNMKLMFSHAREFNQDLSAWNVESVINMDSMFRGAASFDQDLGSWNVSNVVNMNNMFKNVSLSTANYDALLNGWNSLAVGNNIQFHGGNSHYCNGESSRLNLIHTFDWVISDGGRDCGRREEKVFDVEDNTLSEIKLYPNPIGNQFFLDNTDGLNLDILSIYDISGRLIKTVNLGKMKPEFNLDVSSLSPSTYLIKITGENGQISKVMIKQ